MTELARGTVFDRPWGRTLGALSLRGLTGQLTLTSFDGKRVEIAFSHGAVLGATSPIASDAAVRVALTGGLISTTQVAELARKQAAQADRDEIEVIADHLRLGFDQAMRLRRRTVAQRASRSFSFDKGEFVVTDEISIPTVAGSELDIRSIIYLGAKQNLSESRLAAELGLFGSWFRLKPEAFDDLIQFGFTEAERPVIDQLMNGASLGELEGIVGMDGRTVRATLYALCAMNACNVEQTRGQTTKPPPATLNTKRNTGSSPPSTQPVATPPPPSSAAQTVGGTPRSQRQTAQPLVAYRPGMRGRSASAQPPNTTQTPVDINRPMGAGGNTMPPPHARRATTTPPAGTDIVDGGARFPRARSEPGTTRSGDATSPGFARARSEPGAVRTGTGSNPPAMARTTTPPPRTTTPPPSAARTTTAPAAARTTTAPATARTATTSSPATARTTTPPPVIVSRTTTPPPNASPTRTGAATSLPKTRIASSTKLPGLQAPEVLALVAERAKQLDQGADHYVLLGVGPTASGDEIRKTYFNLARQLHPDRLAALGIADEAHVAHKVFAQLNTAFSILSDTKRRTEYDNLLGRGGEAALAAEQAKADELASKIFASEEAYKKGESALKREDLPTAITELARAVELNPDEPDFYALHAWALFCAAADKNSVARQTKATLEKAIQRSPKAINPRFYLGRMFRMLGHDKEALGLFRDVLLDKPHHFEAQAEIRAIEARATTPGKKR